MSISLLTALLILLGAILFITIIVLIICEYGFLPQKNGHGTVINKHLTYWSRSTEYLDNGNTRTWWENPEWFFGIKIQLAGYSKIVKIKVPRSIFEQTQSDSEVLVVYTVGRLSKNIFVRNCYPE